MTPNQWQQIKTILDQALELLPSQRERFIDQQCQDNPWLKAEVGAYLALESEISNISHLAAREEVSSQTVIQPELASVGNHGDLFEKLKPGFLLDKKYEFLRLLGKGGMGYVFLARHRGLGTQVAVKILKPQFSSDQSTRLRFHREAQMAAQIDHPNVVRVQDFGVEDTLCYLVMEYLEGETLRTRLKTGKLESANDLLHLITQVCSALEAIHTKNIIHRDLKPDNIFFHQKLNQEIIKLLDFGVAKTEMNFDQEELTYSGLIVGTPAYMSPEQCRGETLTPASDIYALGVIVYEILSGKKLFEATHPINVLYAHLNIVPPDLKNLVPVISDSLSQTVMRALRKNPTERFQSANEFLAEFQSSLEATGSFSVPAFQNEAGLFQVENTSPNQNRKTPVPRSVATSPVLKTTPVFSRFNRWIPAPVRWISLGLMLGLGSWGIWSRVPLPQPLPLRSTNSPLTLVPTGPELLINSGFENRDGEGFPLGWHRARIMATQQYYSFTWDSIHKHSGNHSVAIEVSPDHPAETPVTYNWTQDVQPQLEAGGSYILSGYIKTGRIVKSPGIMLQCWDKDIKTLQAAYTTTSFSYLTSNQDWTYVQIKAVIPPNTALVTIRAFLNAPVPGGAKVWFDDISLKRL